MAPRGLSAEEKRVKLLEIFHESKDFFQLKELEKLGPKLKGIVSQSVKEVLQSLVDDGLVEAEKIGASNFFWSFPSQRGAMMRNRLQTAQASRADMQKQLEDLRANIEGEKLARPETEDRAAALRELADARAKLAELQAELAQYGACDPKQVDEKRTGVRLAREAAVRWTDNVSLLISHFTRQHGVEASDMRQYLGIKDDFEDIC